LTTCKRPGKGIRGSDSRPATNVLRTYVLSCDLKLVKLSAVHTNEGRLFQTVGVQHENWRAAMFVDGDCVESRSDVDDLRTRDCLYGESREVRYKGCWLQDCCPLAEDSNLVVNSTAHWKWRSFSRSTEWCRRRGAAAFYTLSLMLKTHLFNISYPCVCTVPAQWL